MMLENQSNYSSPPVAPGGAGRRSTKRSAKAPATNRSSCYGESSFERAPDSEAGGAGGQDEARGRDFDGEDDRSDLGFTSQEDADPALPEEAAYQANKQ